MNYGISQSLSPLGIWKQKNLSNQIAIFGRSLELKWERERERKNIALKIATRNHHQIRQSSSNSTSKRVLFKLKIDYNWPELAVWHHLHLFKRSVFAASVARFYPSKGSLNGSVWFQRKEIGTIKIFRFNNPLDRICSKKIVVFYHLK